MTERAPLWIGRLALIFVLASLLALLITPVLVQQRVNRLRKEAEAAGPARALVREVQFDLAHGMAALRGLLIAGDTAFLRVYRETTVQEVRAFRDLEQVADRLGPEVLKRFSEARTLSDQWHRRIEEAQIMTPGRITPAFLARIPTEQSLYDRAISAAVELDKAIARAADRRAQQIREADRLSLTLTLALGGLALLSALVVAWFSHRVRMLAIEAERRQLETERALQDEARTAQSKDRLIRGVTHDIKNPLGAADGYAELLEMGLRGPLAPPQAELVARIRRSIRGALDIIRDLLDLSQAETGALRIQRARIDLGEVLRGIADDHRGSAEAAGHTLELCLAEEPLPVYTDANRVRQILGNLLSNAVKYTPRPGRVTVEAAPAPDGAGPRSGRWLAVHVTDSGPGIPPEKREAVFAEFHRLHGDEISGHGLGLAISRRLARLLGGDVTVAGEQGEGATFTLWLPSRTADEAA